MEFGRVILEKHGWKKGEGLGKRGHGIKEPLRPKKKCKNTGVGYDASAEYTDHWWDRLYSTASSKLVVTPDTQEHVPPHGHESPDIKPKLPQLYGKFLKGATLENGETIHEDTVIGDEEDRVMTPTGRLLDSEMVDKCHGRTAHKGARHGITSGGKLDRLAQQEANFLQERANVETRTQEAMKLNINRRKSKDVHRSRNRHNGKRINGTLSNCSNTGSNDLSNISNS